MNGKRPSRIRITKKWLRSAQYYRRLAELLTDGLDFSDAAAREMFRYESTGGAVSAGNGFLVGKGQLDVMLTMWREDIASGLLAVAELQADPAIPSWVIDRVSPADGSLSTKGHDS